MALEITFLNDNFSNLIAKLNLTHPRHGLDVVEGVLRVKGVSPLKEGDEAAAPAHATVLIPKHIELVNSPELLEEVFERLLVHRPRHLPHEHLDGVVVRDLGVVHDV